MAGQKNLTALKKKSDGGVATTVAYCLLVISTPAGQRTATTHIATAGVGVRWSIFAHA